MYTDKSVNESKDQHLYYPTYLSKTEIMYAILSHIVANDVIVIEQMKIQIYIIYHGCKRLVCDMVIQHLVGNGMTGVINKYKPTAMTYVSPNPELDWPNKVRVEV